MQSVLAATGPMLRLCVWRLLPIWTNFMVSVGWFLATFIGLTPGAVSSLFPYTTGGTLV